MDEHFAYFLANGECRMKVAGEGFCGGGGEKDRWNEKYKSVSVLMRVARDGSHAFRRDAEGKKGKKKGRKDTRWSKEGEERRGRALERDAFSLTRRRSKKKA